MRAFVYDRASSEVTAIRAVSMLAQLPLVQGRAPVEYLAGGTTLIDLMKLDVMRPARWWIWERSPAPMTPSPCHPMAYGLGPWSRCRLRPTIRRSLKPIPSFLKACNSPQARNFATWRPLAAMCCNGPAARISAIRPGAHATNAILVRAALHWTV